MKKCRVHPPSPPVEKTHRGLGWRDMLGKTLQVKRMNFALFCRGMYPPVVWRIPDHLEGPALKLMMEERSAMFRQPKRRDDHG